MDQTKDEAAQQLAEAHYIIDPGIQLIVQLLASPDRESDPKEPVKLLEVNQETTAVGIHPLYFGPVPDRGMNYPSVIIDVTPEEYEEIREKPHLLPNGWRPGREFARPVPAGRP